jgi:hypothetical protein
MLRWFVKRKLRMKVESDLTDARMMLATMKLKLSKEGPEATIAYGEGVGHVADLLAQRFGITVPDALDARGMDWQKLCDGADDLMAAMERSRGLLTSGVQSVRTAGHARTFGCGGALPAISAQIPCHSDIWETGSRDHRRAGSAQISQMLFDAAQSRKQARTGPLNEPPARRS